MDRRLDYPNSYGAVTGQRALSLTTPMLGASGAIAGVMGAYLYSYPSSRKYVCFCFRFVCYCRKTRMEYFILLWIILQFILPILDPHIAVFAHIGGLLTGIALAPFFISKKRVEAVKKAFLSGRYRGLPPDKDDVLRRTFGITGYVITVLAALAVTTIACATVGILLINTPYRTVYPGEGIVMVVEVVEKTTDSTGTTTQNIKGSSLLFVWKNKSYTVIYAGGAKISKNYIAMAINRISDWSREDYTYIILFERSSELTSYCIPPYVSCPTVEKEKILKAYVAVAVTKSPTELEWVISLSSVLLVALAALTIYALNKQKELEVI